MSAASMALALRFSAAELSRTLMAFDRVERHQDHRTPGGNSCRQVLRDHNRAMARMGRTRRLSRR